MAVPDEDWSDAVLVLLGHGSTQNDGSGVPVYQHAAELRRRKLFAAVHEAFWKQEPNVKEILAGILASRVFIVPLFISEGYFSSRVIPQELGLSGAPTPPPPGATQPRGDEVEAIPPQTSIFRYCKPIGTHAGMTQVLLGRARGVVAQFPFPRPPKPGDITLFIAGHGTERDGNSRAAIERQVEAIRARNEYADVHGIFLEETPRIEACYSLARTKNIVVVPFFISDGMHTREDIPVLLGEAKRTVQLRLANRQPPWHNPTERNGKLVWYASAAGTAPEIAEVILERVREAGH